MKDVKDGKAFSGESLANGDFVSPSHAAGNADVTAAYGLGANAFLTEPSESGRLEDIVKAINDFWLAHNALPNGY